MLRAALWSACATTPHDLHTNRAWLTRLVFPRYAQWLHVWEVYARSTATTGTPARWAL